MAEKIENNEPIIFNDEPEEDTFEDWREWISRLQIRYSHNSSLTLRFI